MKELELELRKIDFLDTYGFDDYELVYAFYLLGEYPAYSLSRILSDVLKARLELKEKKQEKKNAPKKDKVRRRSSPKDSRRRSAAN